VQNSMALAVFSRICGQGLWPLASRDHMSRRPLAIDWQVLFAMIAAGEAISTLALVLELRNHVGRLGTPKEAK